MVDPVEALYCEFVWEWGVYFDGVGSVFGGWCQWGIAKLWGWDIVWLVGGKHGKVDQESALFNVIWRCLWRVTIIKYKCDSSMNIKMLFL